MRAISFPILVLLVGCAAAAPTTQSASRSGQDEKAPKTKDTSRGDGDKKLADAAPAAKTRPASADYITMSPLKDKPWYTFKHPGLPGSKWTFRMPEHGFYTKEKGSTRLPHSAAWETAPDGRKIVLRFGVPEQKKKEFALDYWGKATGGRDTIDFELRIKNVGAEQWGYKKMTLFCLQSKDANTFWDYDAKRTFIRKGGKWVTVNEVVEGKFKSHRMVVIGVTRKGGADGKPDRLVAKVSEDGRFVLGLVADNAGTVSFNFQKRVSCIHSNPGWGRLKPGQEATSKGRIYLFEGTLDDLWRRYRKDFGVKARPAQDRASP